MGFWDLLVVALVPVLEVLLVTAIGLLLALDRFHLLGPNARHHLNNLAFYVFFPGLVISQLGETMTYDSLVSLWFMPVNILLTFIIGSLFAWVLIKVTRTPKHLQGLVIGCCSAGNLGNLLLIIVPAVCEESNSPFGSDSSSCATNGKAYASLSMAVGAVYIWTYVYIIMRMYTVPSKQDDGGEEDDSVERGNPSESYTEPLLPSNTSSTGTNNGGGLSVHADVDDAHLQLISSHKKGSTFIGRSLKMAKDMAEKMNLKMVFAPSTIAAIIGFSIGTITPIRKLIIGSSAPLRVIDSSTSLLGDAAIPSMTLIVGANLLAGMRRSEVGILVTMGIIVVRYVLLPAVGIGVVKAAVHFGMVDSSNTLYAFVLLLQYALPPAMTVGTIVQLFEAGEGECSVIMLWTYVVAAFSLTLWSTFYMWLLE